MDKLSNTLPDEQVKEPEPFTTTEIAADLPLTQDKQDPTRFGDWEKNGRCIDF